MSLQLIETKIYKTKVGLFIEEFDRPHSLADCTHILLPNSEVFYDQQTPDGWHVFRVLDPDWTNHYVKIPGYDIENEIENVAAGMGEPSTL